MPYGHAERNLALIRQLDAETSRLPDGIPLLEEEQPADCEREETDSSLSGELLVTPDEPLARVPRSRPAPCLRLAEMPFDGPGAEEL
jgi:hypothetical protein